MGRGDPREPIGLNHDSAYGAAPPAVLGGLALSAVGAAISRLIRIGAVALLGLAVGGCTSLGYLAQAAAGMLELMSRAQPIDEVLKDDQTPPYVAALLAEVPAIKTYGEARGLRATRNYTDYIQLDRSAAVWVVSACEPLRFEPRRWSFPIVGSFTYLGWFHRDQADKLAAELRGEGLDVDVRGAAAFSTLGWFRDAVLSTMIHDDDAGLGDFANIILHESVHATLHVKDQTAFNEQVASFVADRMTVEYLQSARGRSSPEYVAYVSAQGSMAGRTRAVEEAYTTLEALYASSRPDPEKLDEKQRVLVALAASIGSRGEINNATLLALRTYGTEDAGAELEMLLGACGGDWRRFLRTLEPVTREPAARFTRPQQEDLVPVLRSLVREGCQ